jgi:hypothetical protein
MGSKRRSREGAGFTTRLHDQASEPAGTSSDRQEPDRPTSFPAGPAAKGEAPPECRRPRSLTKLGRDRDSAAHFRGASPTSDPLWSSRCAMREIL